MCGENAIRKDHSVPVIRPLTELQMETLGAVVNGTLVSTFKPIGRERYLQFTLPDGREVTRRVVALRKRGYLKWTGGSYGPKIVATPEGIDHWERGKQ